MLSREAWYACGLALCYLSYAAWSGVGMTPDSAWYDNAARDLVSSNFDIRQHLAEARSSAPVFYLGFTALVAVTQVVFGSNWAVAIVGVNVLALTMTGYLAMRLIRRVTDASAPVLIGFLMFLLLFEQLHWASLILTDTIFSFLAFATFYLVCSAWRSRDSGAHMWLAATGLVFLSLLFRPVGIVALTWLALAAPLRLSEMMRGSKIRPVIHRGLKVMLAVAGVLVAIAFSVPGFMDGVSVITGYFADQFARGVVVDARPETYSAPAHDILGAARIVAKRFVYFFAFTASDFSLRHTFLNAIVFLPLYVLGGMGCYFSVMRSRTLSAEAILTGRLAILFATLFAAFHALTVIDFDWRYRVPCYPALIVLAALGWSGMRALGRATAAAAPSDAQLESHSKGTPVFSAM